MSRLNRALNWRPVTPFYYGWLIMGMAALATFACTGLTQVVLGGIQDFISEDTGWSHSTIALAVTLGTWSSGFISPLIGRLADRHGPRWLMPMATVAMAVAFFSLSEGKRVWQFYAAYIFGRGLSNPIFIGVVPRTVAVNFFRRKRNLALALNSVNRPIGGAINIQIIAVIAAQYSWRVAYRYMGILSLAMVLPLILIMRRRPEDIGLLPDGAKPLLRTQSSESGSGTGTSGGEVDIEFSWTAGEAMRTKAFWLVGMTTVLALLGAATIGFAMVPYLRDEANMSTAQAAGVLSLSTFLAIGVLGWGLLADKVTPRRLLMVVLVASSAMVIYLLSVDSLTTAYSFGLMWGLISGTTGVLEQMLLAQYFGRHSFGAITGALTPFSMGALGLGPLLGAGVREVTGSYDQLFIVLAGIYLLAVVLIYFAKPPPLPTRATAPASERVS